MEEMEREGWGEGGGAWLWRRRLLAWEEDSLRERSLLLHNIVLQDSVTDKWRWLLDPIHGYSVRETYRFITNFGDQVDRVSLMMFGTSLFQRRCLYLFGAYSVIGFRRATIW